LQFYEKYCACIFFHAIGKKFSNFLENPGRHDLNITLSRAKVLQYCRSSLENTWCHIFFFKLLSPASSAAALGCCWRLQEHLFRCPSRDSTRERGERMGSMLPKLREDEALVREWAGRQSHVALGQPVCHTVTRAQLPRPTCIALRADSAGPRVL
jgi:hypothetical protein